MKTYLIPAAQYLLSLGMPPEFAARYDPEIAEAMAREQVDAAYRADAAEPEPSEAG